MVMDRKYHRAYSKAYYHKRIAEFKAILGGRCAKCGSTDRLEFDHIDPRSKNFNTSMVRSVSKAKALEELKKCQLLCHDCHFLKTEGKKALTRNDILNIKMLHKNGAKNAELAKLYNRNESKIRSIISGRTYKCYNE